MFIFRFASRNPYINTMNKTSIFSSSFDRGAGFWSFVDLESRMSPYVHARLTKTSVYQVGASFGRRIQENPGAQEMVGNVTLQSMLWSPVS